jgi:hypothetical protein
MTRVRSSSQLPAQLLMWPLAAGLVALSLAPAACSSGASDRPAGIDTGGASGSSGHSGASVGGGADASAEAGDSSSLGGEAAGGDSTTLETDAGTGRPPPGPSVCSEAAAWSGATKVPNVSSAADETLLSVTSDELDLAFLRAGTLYVAHREAASGTFAVGAAVAIPDGWIVTQGAALSADGKRLVLLSTDQTMLGELTRAVRSAAFAGTVDQSAFATVNQTSMYSGNIYASPALSPDDQQLFLNSTAPSGGSTVVAATRGADQSWTSPTRVGAELDGPAGARCLPTALSADARTLFYFNEGTMKEEARWRDEPTLTSPLYDMVDLGMRRGAQPNSTCDRLYSATTGDVFVEHD